MPRESRIPLTAPSEWRDALDGIKHSFPHTWENAYAMHLATGNETYLYSFEADDVRIVCPIAERVFDGHTDIVTPYGLSGFAGMGVYQTFPDHWRQFARQQGYVCGFISMHPLFENEIYAAPEELGSYNVIYAVDLRHSTSELYARLSTNRKRQVRRSVDASDIVRDRAVLSEFFVDRYHAFMAGKGAAPVYHLPNETLAFLTDVENVFLIGARNPDHQLEAVALFGFTEHVATYLFSIAVPGGRSHATTLIWHAMMHVRSLEIPWLDLGGGIREKDSLAEFKRRFGGDALPLKALRQVYNPEIFAKLCRKMNVSPESKGYFPPYRRS